MSMVHWRTLDPQTVHTSDDTTYRVKLPKSGILHSLLLQTAMTNGGTSAQNQYMSDVIDWIKVIADGSKVLFHLEPETIRMVSYAHGLPGLREVNDESASAVQEAEYPIPFGRTLLDPNMWLDLSKFTDVELQVCYSPTIAATSFTTGTFTTTLLGAMAYGGAPGSYQGSLVTRIIENFTTVASGEKVVYPPQRWPYRALWVRCYEAAIADGVDVTNVQFDVNNEEFVPVNLSWSDLAALNYLLAPVNAERFFNIFRADNDTVDTLIARIRSAVLQQITATSVANDTFEQVSIDVTAGSRLTLDVAQADVTAGAETYLAYATDTNHYLHVVGQGLPFAVFVPINNLDIPPYFDPTAYDEVLLTLTQGAAGGDTDVVLQELQAF